MSKEKLEKFRRLTDNGTFRSQNVGRSSPVPYLFIRFQTRKLAAAYKEEIGGGKIKKSGAQCFLMVGPSLLREHLPSIINDLRNKHQQAKIVLSWLKLLDENEQCQDPEVVLNNRNQIEELKKQLIDNNYKASTSLFMNTPDIAASIDVWRSQLAIYEKTPAAVRSVFQKVRIRELRKKIADKDPDGPEAQLLKKEKMCDFEGEEDGGQSMESPGTPDCGQI